VPGIGIEKIDRIDFQKRRGLERARKVNPRDGMNKNGMMPSQKNTKEDQARTTSQHNKKTKNPPPNNYQTQQDHHYKQQQTHKHYHQAPSSAQSSYQSL